MGVVCCGARGPRKTDFNENTEAVYSMFISYQEKQEADCKKIMDHTNQKFKGQFIFTTYAYAEGHAFEVVIKKCGEERENNVMVEKFDEESMEKFTQLLKDA